MKTTELISVIVPVYNTELYLSDCIESVLKQTYPNLELILVDDCSEDKSGEICREACKTDPRITFLPQENKKGVSAARNRAVGAAKGDYLFFLDSDDVIHPGLLETLIQSAGCSGVSIAAVLPYRMDTNDFGRHPYQMAAHEIPREFTYLKGREILDWIAVRSQERDFLYSGIGGKLIQAEKAKAFRFDEKLCNGEDTKYMYELLANGADVVLLQGIWYYYRMHSGNASKKRSAKACTSLYQCEKYIFEREHSEGRTANAVRQEKLVIDRLLDWYRFGRRNGDAALWKSMRQLLKREIYSEENVLLSVRDRIKAVFAVYNYPIYMVLHIYFRWRWEWGERKRSGG